MSFVNLPTRTSEDLNSSADINQLMENIKLIAGNGEVISTKTIQELADFDSDFSDNVKTELNATGDAPLFACRAWVNFNGTGTVAIRESGNVDSITDSGVGKYSVNFLESMEDANYSAVGSCTKGNNNDNANALIQIGGASTNYATSQTADLVKVQTIYPSNLNYQDPDIVSVAIFR